jgi:phenylacetate-coenzyme A ligase PaaK-like adenylate-forming protein
MLASERPRAASISESPLAKALRFAVKYSPYYRTQAWAFALRQGGKLKFSSIPVTPVSVVKVNSSVFFSTYIAPDQGEVVSKYTSGSTGQTLEVRSTQRDSLGNRRENERLCKPWEIRAHKRVVYVRPPDRENPPGTIEERRKRGGGLQWEIYSMEGKAVADLLQSTRASFVNGLPSKMQTALENNSRLNALRLVGTVGEIIAEEFRSLVEAVPGRRLFDSYGCTEAGIVAAQCPLCNAYHLADRHLYLELLNDDGSPTPPGGMGRVVITPYYNQAMPLIRYEIGDYAVRSKATDCPNGKQALDRIVGRKRNLFTLPNGQKITPYFPAKEAYVLGIQKFKLVQLSLDHVELRYIPLREETELSPQMVQNIIDRYLSPQLKVTPVKVRDIPRAPSGKYLMHESMVE